MELSLHGNYIPESDQIRAEAVLHDGDDFHVGEISSGSISLINVVSGATGNHDAFIATVNIEDQHRKEDGTIFIDFNHPKRTTNLEVFGSVWVVGSATALTQRVEVLREDEIVNLPENVLPELEEEIPPDPGLEQGDEIIEETPEPEPEPTIVEVDFSEHASITSAGIEYLGGGSRLLPVDDQLVLQEADELPSSIGAQCFIEETTKNFVPNAAFGLNTNNIPTGWSINAPKAVLSNRLLNDISQAARTWGVRFRNNTSNQPTNSVYLTSNSISILPLSGDITFSLLGSIGYGDRDSSIQTIRLTIYFQDASESVLGSVKKDFNANSYVGVMAILYSTVAAASIPGGTTKATLQVELFSVDQGDDVEFFMFMPQLEYNSTPTSRTLNTRQADFYYFTPNVETNKGSIAIKQTFGYTGTPSSDKYLFSNF